MNYLYLLKSLLDYNYYTKYRHHIKLDKAKDKEIYWLFIALDEIFKTTDKSISFEDYALWVTVKLGNDYNVFLSAIKEQDSNPELIEASLKHIKERSLAYDIAQLSLLVSEGREPTSKLKELVSKLEEETATENVFVTSDLETLYNEQLRLPGLRWRLNSLNRSLGSLRKGDFGFIFARPETGKTTFLASEVSYMAQQAEGPILWFNNEEQGNKVMLRTYQGTLGIRIEQLKDNIKKYHNEYLDITKDRIKIIDNASLHKQYVQSLCKEYNPSLIIFDQLDKIKGFDSDRDDLRLGSIYIWGRELAKQYAPVIAVSQADVSGEGKKYLTMDNVAGAKTAKQAEADWILGIGKSNDPGFELIRHFNIPKNKLTGDEDSDPNMRHAKIDVLIEPTIARYRDL